MSSGSTKFPICYIFETYSHSNCQVVFYVEEYYYGGKHLNCMQHLEQVMEGLQVNGVPPKMVVVPYWGEQNKVLRLIFFLLAQCTKEDYAIISCKLNNLVVGIYYNLIIFLLVSAYLSFIFLSIYSQKCS